MSRAVQVSDDRLERLRRSLTALAPTMLDIRDESHLHAGHAGAQTGRGHYRLRIVSERFAGLGRIARHRVVYAALGTLMQTDIHALSLETLTPAEAEHPPHALTPTTRGTHES